MTSIFRLLSVSGSGNNCLYVAAATHLLSLIWTESITPRQLDFLHKSLNNYLDISVPKSQFLAIVENPRNHTDWSLILGVAIRQELQMNSEAGAGEFISQAVELSERLGISEMIGIEIQSPLVGVFYRDGGTLQEIPMVISAPSDLRAVNGKPLIDWVKDKDTLSLYMEGLSGNDAGAHCHYGLLVDTDTFSQDRGFVVHPEDESRISSESLPGLTQEGCNDPDFDWTSLEVKAVSYTHLTLPTKRIV